MTLTDAQIDRLYEIEQTCFGDSWTRQMLLEELLSPLSVLCTEQRGGTVIGFALGRVAADEGELFQIGVLPEFRRQGAALSLLERFHEELRSRGASCCFLEVRSRNAPAIALYERSGYERISLRRGYYGDDDALIYKLML